MVGVHARLNISSKILKAATIPISAYRDRPAEADRVHSQWKTDGAGKRRAEENEGESAAASPPRKQIFNCEDRSGRTRAARIQRRKLFLRSIVDCITVTRTSHFLATHFVVKNFVSSKCSAFNRPVPAKRKQEIFPLPFSLNLSNLVVICHWTKHITDNCHWR